jgi:hypothetical protein
VLPEYSTLAVEVAVLALYLVDENPGVEAPVDAIEEGIRTALAL